MKPKMERMTYIAKCRAFQQAMKVFNYTIPYRTPICLEGSGSVEECGRILRENGFERVFVVTDKMIESLGLLSGLEAGLQKAAIVYDIFDEVEANPTTDTIENGYCHYALHQKQPLIALGGGSVIDTAKAIAAKSVHPRKSIHDLQGICKVHKKIPLLIAIPTTSGTGSETTLAAVITDTKTSHKASINDPCLIPKYAVLDPDLTMSLPPKISVTTGLDALTHAVESYLNGTYNTPLENFMAKEAVRLIYENLMQVYHHGEDREARLRMQKASFYAGRSFTRGCVGYVHAVGHTFSGLYKMPHGLAMSIVLPHVLRQYGKTIDKKLAELADVCKIPGTDTHEKAERFIAWIEKVKEETGIPKGVKDIQEEDIAQIISWAIEEANPLYPTPVVWMEDDFKKLIDTLRN